MSNIKGKDIKRGDLIRGFGIVISVDHEPCLGDMWRTPRITFIDQDDPYYGECSTELHLDREYTKSDTGLQDALNDARAQINKHIESLQENLLTLDNIEKEIING